MISRFFKTMQLLYPEAKPRRYLSIRLNFFQKPFSCSSSLTSPFPDGIELWGCHVENFARIQISTRLPAMVKQENQTSYKLRHHSIKVSRIVNWSAGQYLSLLFWAVILGDYWNFIWRTCPFGLRPDNTVSLEWTLRLSDRALVGRSSTNGHPFMTRIADRVNTVYL